MGRPKGFIVSEATKMKAHATRKAKKEGTNIIDPPYSIQTLFVSGKEKEGFDYWPALRKALRPIHQYALCSTIEHEIVAEKVWDDIESIKLILSKYFIIKKGAAPESEKIKRNITLSEDERKKRSDRMKARRKA